LIVLGHRDAWEYGYSFFKICCEEMQHVEKKQISNMIFSIQLAFAKKREVEKFFKGEK